MPTDNIYYVDSPSDIIVEAPDDGRDRIYASIDYILPENIEELVLYKSGNLQGAGNTLDNLIVGNNGDNFLFGLAGADKIYGGEGNDVLDGGTGMDLLVGGRGNDVYYIDSGADNVVEYAGEGIDRVYASFSYALNYNVEQLVLTGTLNVRGIGNKLDNLIIGNAGNNYLFGDDGKDHLIGGAGNDILDGAWDVDVMQGGTGDDIYYVNAMYYWGKYLPNVTKDTVIEYADEGHDLIYATFAYNLPDNVEDGVLINGKSPYPEYVYWALSGNDLDNVLRFAPVDGQGGAALIGGNGNDVIYGGGTTSSMQGGQGDDQIFGGSGFNYFSGDEGDDIMVAGSSRNNFELGSETSGADRIIFKFERNLEENKIYNFASSSGSKIDFSQMDALTGTAGNDEFVLVSSFTGRGGELILRQAPPETEFGDPAKSFDIVGDTDGDGVVDFTVHLYNAVISAGDIIL